MDHLLILIFTTLLTPLGLGNSQSFIPLTRHSVFTTFLVSLLFLLNHISDLQDNSTTKWSWLDLGPTDIHLSFMLDTYSMIFLPVAFFVSWCILNYSTWYMMEDPKINRFSKYLLIFLTAMICLVTANNMFTLFIGWEGVGMMSFLLIGWYHSRASAATSALQAVLYNRVGDIGFLYVFCWMVIHYASLDLQFIVSMKTSLPPLIGLITAAASKSAQFSLHPWLVAAMEGPTPVSALLHSSTMVIAGIFLLIRIHPLIQQNPTASSLCLLLGAISTAYAATCALMQFDIKKIIAYSTSSQLGLMMIAIGLNQPNLAFLHISTHAFFKAMLFLCSGLIIHNLDDEQDIRKMGGLMRSLPITISCFTIGSLALMAAPFLAGFYSKDPIIETLSSSYVNIFALTLALIATMFTAAYSVRLIFYATMFHPNSPPLSRINENYPNALHPIIYLAIGSICSGIIISLILPMNQTLPLTVPIYIKLAALAISSLAFLVAYDIMQISQHNPSINHSTRTSLDPLTYSFLLHRTFTHTSMNLSWRLITHTLEMIILKKLAPELFISFQMTPTQAMKSTQKGLIKLYLSVLFVSLILIMAFILLFSSPPVR